MNGTHIIVDLHDINFSKLNLNEDKLKIFFSEAIKNNNLTELGSYYHTFANPSEVTGIIALAESHISFHTWPELGYISLDIFVCNITSDSSSNAEKLYSEIIEFFEAKNVDKQTILRKNI